MYPYHPDIPRTRNEGQVILMERQGTVWEGSGKKELPEWMTNPEAADDKQVIIHKNPLIRAARLLASVVGLSLSS